MVTAEHLSEFLSKKSNKLSREMKSSSTEWILIKTMFQKLMQALGSKDMHLFLSSLCRYVPRYLSWQPDPHVLMSDTFQIN